MSKMIIPEQPEKEKEVQAIEILIQAKMREQAITALVAEGKLTENGKLKKEENI